ncbi:PREDICTED: transcriptional regulator Myc-B-like, partial [Rhagoletis zephyria]|uniref:transcriptional regulator Myc-B-like n=1 Tax=Rhagoletis zephyria TaxID=28612 RepID=UPI0008114EEB
MPVKVDSSRCCSPTPFDADLLTDFEQELVNDCLSNLDVDMWGNLTPPASPQIKLDFMDLNLDNLLDDSDEMMMDFDQKLTLINHDCMWSGQCSEGHCNSSAKPSTSCTSNSSLNMSSSWTRPDTPGTFNLSTSPITNNLLGDLTYSDFADLSELTSLLESDLSSSPQSHSLLQPQQQQQSFQQQSGNVFAGMANDHSYESSSPVSTIKEEVEDEIIVKKESSLLSKNPIKILNAGKINKMKCKKISGGAHKNSTSLLTPTNIIYRPSSSSLISKGETSIVQKPQIFQVANFKNLPENTIHGKVSYKVTSIKKTKGQPNKTYLADVKTNGTTTKLSNNRLVHVKKVHQFASNISTLISPNTSDSEESSISGSGSSSGDDNRKNSPPFRRREHNDSERKRRDHLRNSFNNLKDQIPKLKSAEKRPPRIMILHEATNYVTSLINTNYNLEKTLEAEKEKKKRLMNLLKSMQQDS